MQQKLLALFLLVFSSSCAHAPKGPVCIADVSQYGFHCYNSLQKREYFLPFSESDKDILLPRDFAFELFQYCKGK